MRRSRERRAPLFPGRTVAAARAAWIVLAVLTLAASESARGGTRARDPGSPFALLQQLVEVPGVSTREERVRDAIRGLLPAWASGSVDSAGNLLVMAGPEKAKTSLLFIAHMDETGYVVTAVNGDGSLEVKRIGGFFEMLYEGQVVLVRTAHGDIGGLVPPRPGYFASVDAPAAFGGGQVTIDLGTSGRAATEALGIAAGDTVTIPKAFVRLAGSKGSGRAVDDRAGCTALLLAMRRIDPGRLKNRVVFAFSVREETGLEGAAAMAKSLRPDLVVAVDTFVSSDSPLERHGFANAILGQGPVVRAIDSSNITHRDLVDRVVALARGGGLPIQYGLTRGGNDGSVFPEVGVPEVAISWPTVHSHSAVEVIDERDLASLGDLVGAIAERW
jgi:putative aminopeptidase